MPIAVGVEHSRAALKAGRTHIQATVLQANINLVLLPPLCLAVREQGAIKLVGAEPEHQGVIVQSGTAELRSIDLQALCAVQLQGEACRTFPGVTVEHEVHAAGSLVPAEVALALVQFVIVHQSVLIARERLLAVGLELLAIHAIVPQTEFKHLARVVLKRIEVCTHVETRTGLVDILDELLANGLRAVEEGDGDGVGVLLHGVGHLAQHIIEGNNAVRHELLAVHGGRQVAVGTEAEGESLLFATMHEHGHISLFVSGIQHHVQGEVTSRKVAFTHCPGDRLAAEVERRRGGDVGTDRRAQHLEVVNLTQVVAGNGLGEGNLDVIADVQDAVNGFGCSEQTRQTGILDTAQNGRRGGEEASGMTSIDHGTQVVVLLYGVGLAIEGSHDDAVIGDGVGYSAGLSHEAAVGIVRADVHPVLIALCRELVLQLDVVEAASVHVEALDAYRHIPRLALAVVWALGVDHPVVARHSHLDVACRRDEVSREFRCEHALAVLGIHQADGQILVVEVIAGIDGNLLGEHIGLACGRIDDGIEYDVLTRTSERRTVDADCCALRVAVAREEVVEYQRSTIGIVSLVGHVEFEACGLVDRHVALHRLFNPDTGLVGGDSSHVDDGARLVPLGDAGILVRLAGHAGTCAEDEAGVDRRLGIRGLVQSSIVLI